MPVHVTWEEVGACMCWHGFVPAKVFTHALLAFQHDPRLVQARYVLVDLTGVTTCTVTEGDVRQAAANGLRGFHRNPDLVLAVVSTNPAIDRLVDLYVHPCHTLHACCRCADLAQARAWIAAQLDPGRHELHVSLESHAAVDAWHQDWQTSGFPVAEAPAVQGDGYAFVGASPDGHRLQVMAPANHPAGQKARHT